MRKFEEFVAAEGQVSNEAALRYQDLVAEVDAKLEQLAAILARLGKLQAQDPKDWGIVGSMEHINSSLANIIEGFEDV